MPTVTLSKSVGERLDLISNSSSQNRVILPFSVQNNSSVPIDFIVGIKIGNASEVYCYMNNTTKNGLLRRIIN